MPRSRLHIFIVTVVAYAEKNHKKLIMNEKIKSDIISELQDCNTKISAIHLAGQKLGRITEPDKLAYEIILILEKLISYENCAVLLLENKDDTLYPFAISSQGKGFEFVEKDKLFIMSHSIKVGKGIVGWVAKYGETIRSGDVNKDSRYYSLRDDINSELCVPLIIDKSIIGVVNIETSKPNAYSEADQLLLESISSQIAISIKNAKMFKEIQEYSIELSNQIIKRKEIEKELVDAKEKAEESNRLKSAFLANMSHEIRTPMNGILGFAGLLKEPGLTGEEQQKYIGIIEKGGARMLNIINDIVSISKIESGLMEVNMQESNINDQVEYVYTFFKPEVERKGMQFSFKNSLPLKEAIIKTDREKVFAILTNLVKNAIKYTEKGSIEFGYLQTDGLGHVQTDGLGHVQTDGLGHVQTDGLGHVQTDGRLSLHAIQFYVKDTGIGIPKDRQEAIFERFIQADIADKMAYQGAGLGLSISKAYVEMLGGTIWVESEEGKGSTFYFTLPYTSKKMEEKNAKNEDLTA